MTPLELATAFTLKEEGAFTIDDGGPTMYGVTQAVYDAYRAKNGLPQQTVANIAMAEVNDIMETEYWVPAHCDALSAPIAIAMFDWAYNHSPTGAMETLQMCVGVEIDGQYGPKTAVAVVAMPEQELLASFLNGRRSWYHHAVAVNPQKYGRYLDGWLKRVNDLAAYLQGVS